LVLVSNGPFAPATLAKAGAGNHMHTIVENASVVNAIKTVDVRGTASAVFDRYGELN
jgi:hypothetical protein